jgi:hypothetical protein
VAKRREAKAKRHKGKFLSPEISRERERNQNMKSIKLKANQQ